MISIRTEFLVSTGIITPTGEYFRILREICTRYNVMLIYDEIITGIGKTGSMFAAQTFGVTPDLIWCGKGLSSGMMPIGAVITREDMADAFWGNAEDDVHFAHGHTFAGKPMACAVGIVVVEEIVENRLDHQAREMGEHLAGKLKELKKYGVVREVRGKGILRGVELVKNSQTMDPYPELGYALKRTAIDNGLIMRIDPCWFAVAPALIASKPEIDEMCSLIERSLLQALEGVRSGPGAAA